MASNSAMIHVYAIIFSDVPRGSRPSEQASLIKRLRRQLNLARQQTAKYRALARESKRRQQRSLTVDEIITAASKYLNGPVLEFFAFQLRCAGQMPRGRRFDANQKLLALSIFHRSPAAYRFMSSFLCLPSVRSLRRWLHGMQFEPGFCERVFCVLKQKVACMSSVDKMAVLVVDEMALKTALEFDSRRDIVDGFEDDGVVRVTKPASEALVFMVKGLVRKWKQPLCYFLSGGPTNSCRLTDLVLDCIVRLQGIGITVMVVVCDQGANNRGMFCQLGIEVHKPFVTVDGRKVYFMYDPPHLLKSVRNNLRRYPMKVSGGGVAKWDHIKALFDLDSRQKLRLAPKLKFSHVLLSGFKEMNVRLAAQVFSHSVATAMKFYMSNSDGRIPADALVTVDMLLMMDKIFDSCNGVNFRDVKEQRRPVTCRSYHSDFWLEAIAWLEGIEFVGAKARIYCVEGWRLSLNVMRLLWSDVQSDVKFLLPRRLNQDCLESFFAAIRQKGGFRDNPSCSHFRSAMRQTVANKLLSSLAGGNSECNNDQLLLSLCAFAAPAPNRSEPPARADRLISRNTCSIANSLPKLLTRDSVVDVVADNCMTYIAGYIVHKVKKGHSCHTCSAQLCKPGVLENKSLEFIRMKAICSGDFGGLQIPSDELVRYLHTVEAEFIKLLPLYVCDRSILSKLNNAVSNSCTTDLSETLCIGVFDIIRSMYLRLRMHSELPVLLLNITSACKGRKNRKLAKLQHL